MELGVAGREGCVLNWEELYEVLVLVWFCLLALVERFFLRLLPSPLPPCSERIV